MALQILFRECRLSQKNAWESEKNARGKITQVVTLVNDKKVFSLEAQFYSNRKFVTHDYIYINKPVQKYNLFVHDNLKLKYFILK